MRMACVVLLVCSLALSVALASAQSLQRGPGPTSPEVRAEKLKANHVGLPTREQVRRIEAGGAREGAGHARAATQGPCLGPCVDARAESLRRKGR